jgi:hypothetical protein
MGRSSVQGVLLTLHRIKKLKKWPRFNKGLQSNNNNNSYYYYYYFRMVFNKLNHVTSLQYPDKAHEVRKDYIIASNMKYRPNLLTC